MREELYEFVANSEKSYGGGNVMLDTTIRIKSPGGGSGYDEQNKNFFS